MFLYLYFPTNYYLFAGIFFLLVGSLASLIYHKKEIYILTNFNNINKLIKILLIIYVILFIISIYLFYNSELFKNDLFYLIVSFHFGIIFLELSIIILNKNQNSFLIHCILFQLIISSLFLKFTFFDNIFQYQEDPGVHRFWTLMIVSSGHVPGELMGDYYSSNFIFHIHFAMMSIIEGMDPVKTQIVMVFIQTLSILFIFILIKNLLKNIYIALLGALLFSIFGLTVIYSVVITTEGYSTILVLLFFYCYIIYFDNNGIFINKNNKIKYLIIALLSFSILIFIHIQYSFAAILFAITYSLSISIAQFNKKSIIIMKKQIVFISIITITWFSKQAYSGVSRGFYEGIISMINSFETLFSSWSMLGQMSLIEPPISSPTLFILSLIGILAFFGLYIGGVFSILKLDWINLKFVGIWGIITFSIIFIGLIIGEKIILFSRFYYFLGIVLVILSSIFIYYILIYNGVNNKRKYYNNKIIKLAVLFVVVTSITFFSFSSESNNNRDPSFYKYQKPMVVFHTISEYSNWITIDSITSNSSTIVTDFRISQNGSYPYNFSGNISYFSNASMNEIELLDNYNSSYVMINKYSIEKGMMYSEGQGIISYGWSVNKTELNNRLYEYEMVYNSNINYLYYNN